MAETAIEWTDATWNPTTGCDLLSPGCAHCYAQTMSHRLKLMGNPKYANDFKLTLHFDTLATPKAWKAPRMIFVNSMSDLFHHRVPLGFIQRVFRTMRETPWHTYQVLTKRSGRLLGFDEQIDWPPNVWMGVSVELNQVKGRIDHLRRTGAAVKFISCEPLLGELHLDLSGIDWVICGGESGRGARPMQPDWARSVRDQCVARGVPFFFKQWGEHLGGMQDGADGILNSADQPIRLGKKRAGALLDGREWKQFPERNG